MTHTSSLRGHSIEFKQGTWVYSDTKEPCSTRRDCGHCGKKDTPEGHDGCVGTLDGVMNACCGHGVTDEAYVQLSNDTRLAGQAALKFIDNEQNGQDLRLRNKLNSN